MLNQIISGEKNGYIQGYMKDMAYLLSKVEVN